MLWNGRAATFAKKRNGKKLVRKSQLAQREPIIALTLCSNNSVSVFEEATLIAALFCDGNWRQAEAWIVLLAGVVEVNTFAQGALRQAVATAICGKSRGISLLSVAWQITCPCNADPSSDIRRWHSGSGISVWLSSRAKHYWYDFRCKTSPGEM